MDRIDELLARGIELRNMDTDEPLATVRDRIQSANAYLGAEPIVEALDQGAQIVITGRCTDTGLTLAPLIHEFGWKADDWNMMAAGTIAGHIIECGAQASGGNCQYDWQSIPDLGNVGFPIVEVTSNGGSFGGLMVSRMFLMNERYHGSSTLAANNRCRWASALCGSFAPGNAIGSW